MNTDPQQYPGRRTARRFAVLATFTSFTIAAAALLAGCGAGGTAATTLKPTPELVPAPIITGITPNSGTIQGDTTVNVTGSGFLGTPTITFDGKAGTVISTDILGTRIVARTPTNFNRLGAVDVVVNAQGGTATLAGGFTITPASVTFGTSVTAGVGDNPTRLEVQDVNNDGFNDILTGNGEGRGVSTVLNNGNRTFRAPVHSITQAGCIDFAIGDLNGDLLPDVCFIGDISVNQNESNNVVIMTNQGNGVFLATSSTTTSIPDIDTTTNLPFRNGVVPKCVEVLQIDNVSNEDIVAGRESNEDLEGSRDFVEGFRFPYAGDSDVDKISGIEPTDMAKGEFNGDAFPDLLTACSDTGEIHLLLGDGASFVSNPLYLGSFFNQAGAFRVLVDDVDQDGNQDFFSIGDSGISVFYGDGAGNFPVSFRFPASGVNAVVFQDVNGDDIKDMIYAVSPSCFIVERASARELTGGRQTTFDTSLNSVTDLRVANMDGDTIPDLVVLSAADAVVRIFPNATNFPTLLSFSQGQSLAVGPAPEGIDARDVDEDGDLDLVVTASETGARAYLGDASGTFEESGISQAATPLLLGAAGGAGDGGTSRVELDLDGDGDIDTVASQMDRGVIEVTLSDGRGGTDRQATYEAGAGAHALATGDLDGDGRVDVAVANTAAGSVTVFRNAGDGSLTAVGTYAVGASPIDIAIGDVNGDGRMDVMAANFDSGTVSILAQE